MFLGFFHFLFNRSMVPFIRSNLVSSLFAVTIHSTYSFLLLKESELKNASAVLFFFRAAANSSGKRMVFFSALMYLKISLTLGSDVLFLSASVFKRQPKADQVSLNEIRFIHCNSSCFNRFSQPLSRVRSVCIFEVPFG